MVKEVGASVLMVGSFPFETAREAFDVSGPALAGVATRLPDGEAQGWVNFAIGSLKQAKGLILGERTGQNQPELPKFALFELKSGATAEDLAFVRVGYDRIALDSYAVFKERRASGKIASGTRFQVSLPTPFGIIGQFVVPEDVGTVLPVFEKYFLEEVATIVQGIPHQDLALQWDIAVEIINGLLGHRPGLVERYSLDYLAQAIARVTDAVPADVEVGLHFCYGNPGGRHIIEPDDTGLMVKLANAVTAHTKRHITWLHMPVPKNRDDDAYFTPLTKLDLRDRTELYLGLVHLGDGIDGAKRRISAAKNAIDTFGVAYECGLRLFEPDTIPAMLQLHKDVAQLV
jgi:hypothetical protein